MMNPAAIESARVLIDLAFAEDLRDGTDVTSEALIPSDHRGSATIVARQAGIVCGLELIPLIIERFSADLEARFLLQDGSAVTAGTPAATLRGSTIDLLKTERTILNFMGRLSGIASLTGEFVQQTAGTSAKILDTRKTTPGWRALEKYAVVCGGGQNHRFGLHDAVLIKDNHLAALSAAADSPNAWLEKLQQAITTVRTRSRELTIEVEVDTLEQFEQVLPLQPDIILLDNMSATELQVAVALRGTASVELEASGGVNLETVGAIARSGVDRISVGALTHSAVNLDWGLDWQATDS